MQLKDDFSKWLKKEGIKSVDAYLWPLNQKYRGKIVLVNSNVTYELIYQYFLAEGNYDWVDRILEEFRKTLVNSTKTERNHNNYLKALKNFLQGEARFNQYPTPKDFTINPGTSKRPLLYVKYPSFDGMTSLLDIISVEEILELTFNNSIFFDSETAKKQFNDLELKCKRRYSFTARGNDKKCPQYNLQDEHIAKDTDGNTGPRNLIREKFGYNLSGENKNFYGYTISHIWGNASNPLFFTNLANLALIPDWINHLLDKYSSMDEDKGRQEQVTRSQKKALQIVNTIRKVAYTHYNINRCLQGSILKSDDFPIQNKYIIPGDYTINVMMPHNTKGIFDTKHGAIEHEKVSISL